MTPSRTPDDRKRGQARGGSGGESAEVAGDAGDAGDVGDGPRGPPEHASGEAAYPQACPVVEAIDMIGTEWRLVVLHALQDGELRFNEIEDETGGCASTLSRVLDELEDAGLVERRVEERPLATYYGLTGSGRQLGPVFDELACWASDNLGVPPE